MFENVDSLYGRPIRFELVRGLEGGEAHSAWTCGELSEVTTGGKLSHRCYTLEGAQRIAAGEYDLGVRYSPKHARDVLWIPDVPGRQWIELHEGNTVADTLGCVLLGFVSYPGRLEVSRACVDYMERLYIPLVKERGARIVVR